MLAITQAAADVLESYVAAGEDDSTARGVRIAARGDNGASSLSLSLVEEPQPNDAVLSAGTFSVYLEPTAAEMLDTKVLDAEVNPEGSVGFVVAEREP